METLKTVLYVVQILVCLVLIVTVLLQEGNSYGLSGSIAGGAETFFGKGKAQFSGIHHYAKLLEGFLFNSGNLYLTHIQYF